jgi:hypothetical protein
MITMPPWLPPDSLMPVIAFALGVGFLGLLLGLAIGLAGKRRVERRIDGYLKGQNALFKSEAASLETLAEVERSYFMKAGELAVRYRELLARARVARAMPGPDVQAAPPAPTPAPADEDRPARQVPAREWGAAVATIALLHLNEAIDMVATTADGAAWITALDPAGVRAATLAALPALQAAEGPAMEALASEGRLDPILRLAALLDAYAPPAPAYAAFEAAALLAAAGIKAVFAEADIAIDCAKPLTRVARASGGFDAEAPAGLTAIGAVKSMVLEAAVDVASHQHLIVDPGIIGYRRGERVLATARPVVFNPAVWT